MILLCKDLMIDKMPFLIGLYPRRGYEGTLPPPLPQKSTPKFSWKRHFNLTSNCIQQVLASVGLGFDVWLSFVIILQAGIA